MYQVWTVYEKDGFNVARFYVINTQTKKVQSSWTTLIMARTTCRKLNAEVDNGAQEA